jgi:hypothetical protein
MTLALPGKLGERARAREQRQRRVLLMRKAAVRRAMGKQDTRRAFFLRSLQHTHTHVLLHLAFVSVLLGAQEYNSSALGYFIYFAH